MPRDVDRPRRFEGDEGFTLIAVVTCSMLVMLLAAALLTDSVSQASDSHRVKRDDQLIASAEAVIDRYASKLTINPQYFLQRVDESERARTCTDSTHASNNVEVAPGNDWIDGCAEWAYLSEPADGDWFTHPLLTTEEDVESLIEISPPDPDDGGGVEIRVVGRIADRDHYRSISAEIDAISLSQFVRVTQNDLSYGGGARLTGKVYSGGNLQFGSGAEVYADIYAEGTLRDSSSYPCPTFFGAEAYDSGSGNCGAQDVRTVFPEAFAFTNFWDDLERIVDVACGGSGLCFSGYEAYMIHPYLDGGDPRVAVWASDTNPPMHSGCSANAESSWWLRVQESSIGWTSLGTMPYPANGVIWADGHVILGNRGPFPSGESGDTAVVSGGLTVLAGSKDNQSNFILNTEIEYSDPNSFDVIGMIASDEFLINPYAVGSDLHYELRGAVLSQHDKWGVPYWCGKTGNNVRFKSDGTPTTGSSKASLNVTGSIASPNTGNPSGTFYPRTYGFDERLAYLRPPFYPLIGDDWSYENWSEDTIPDWAK